MDDAFVELVREMRAKQKEYFRTRDYAVMREAKRLEHEVDERILHLTEEATQPSLFDTAKAPSCPC